MFGLMPIGSFLNNMFAAISGNQTAPYPPENVVAVASAPPDSAVVDVSFDVPISDGNSAITGYTVTASPGGATWVGAASPIYAYGLTLDTEYTFTVHATNAIGDSVESGASNAVTPYSTSGALTALLEGDGLTVADYDASLGVTGTLNASAWANQMGIAGPLLQATGAAQPIVLPFALEWCDYVTIHRFSYETMYP